MVLLGYLDSAMKEKEMKTIQFLMVGLVSVFLMIGCESISNGEFNDEQRFVITNSSSSTFRIVAAEARIGAGPLGRLTIAGDGIHRGESQYVTVSDDQCDNDLTVFVTYNDPEQTTCNLAGHIPCGGTASFVFNNTNC